MIGKQMNTTNASESVTTAIATDVPITDLTDQYVFIGCGVAALLTNLLIFFVLFRNIQLMKKSAFMIGLAFGDAINGLALLSTGIKRIHYAHGMSNSFVRRFECLQGFTTLWLIGGQLTMVMMLFSGIERTIAVVYFSWYYAKWTSKLEWILVGSVFLYVSISVGIIWIINYYSPLSDTISLLCYTPQVIGTGYGIYNYGLAIFCGFTAILTSLASLLTMITKNTYFGGNSYQNNSAQLMKFIKKQMRITRSLTCIAICDFVMVVIPNIILLLYAFQITFSPVFKKIGLWSADLVCSRSALSIFVYLVFNRDFRGAFFSSIGIKVNTVLPINIALNVAGKTNPYDIQN